MNYQRSRVGNTPNIYFNKAKLSNLRSEGKTDLQKITHRAKGHNMKKIVQVVQLDTLIDILVMTSSHYDKNKL